MEISFEKLKQMIKLSSDLILLFQIADGELKLVYFSSGVAALYGFSDSEFSEKKKTDIFSVFSEYDREKIKKGCMGIINNDTTFDFNVIVHDKHGSFVSCEGYAFYLGEYNNLPTIIANLSEKSGRNRNQELQLLYQNEERYKNVISFANIYVWDYDIKKNRLCNDNGWVKENNLIDAIENFPKSFVDNGIISLDYADQFINDHDKFSLGFKKLSFEYWFNIKKLRNPVCLKVNYSIDFDEEGFPDIAHGIAIDVTELKNAESAFISRSNAAIKVNKDVLASFQVNVTENSIMNYYLSDIVNELYPNMERIKTLDQLVSLGTGIIKDKTEQIRFINTFSMGNLIASFNSGEYRLSFDHHGYYDEGKKFKWIRTSVEMFKNPSNGNVEAVIRLVNIHNNKVLDSMLGVTFNTQFDFAINGNLFNDDFIFFSPTSGTIYKKLSEFDKFIFKIFAGIVDNEAELAKLKEAVNYDVLVSNYSNNDEFSFEFNTDYSTEKNHRKQINVVYTFNYGHPGFRITCRDITEIYNADLKQKQILTDALLQAQEASNAKSAFLSTVSHDIRTPLNGIIGMNELALKEKLSDKVRNYLEKAKTSSDFLMGLINDLLDMSKIEAGKMEILPEMYSVNQFTDYINAVIVPLCDSKKLAFEFSYKDAGIKAIKVDKLRFNQIFFNLLSNAVKYTNSGGNVSFICEQNILDDTNAEGRFIIKDNGIGMSPEFQKHLFDTFVQENRKRNEDAIGSGLGLSIVHSLITLMDGEISVESEENKGTTFYVTLKYEYTKDESLCEETDGDSILPDLSGKHVLLCEDNYINQEIAVELLKSLGADVSVAGNGQIGCDMFAKSEEGYYSLVFMDVRMPIMNGLDATKNIRSMDRDDSINVPIIAMTANAMNEDKNQCLIAGMTDFLAKPINVKYLYKIINKAL